MFVPLSQAPELLAVTKEVFDPVVGVNANEPMTAALAGEALSPPTTTAKLKATETATSFLILTMLTFCSLECCAGVVFGGGATQVYNLVGRTAAKPFFSYY